MTRPDKLRGKGVERFLNDLKEQHNGLGYVEFSRFIEYGTPIAKIAKKFGVSRPTVHNWLAHYERELLEK